MDTSVRDCWQIDSTRVRLSGKAWPDTLAKMLDVAAMRTVTRSAPAGEQSAVCAPDLARLHAAVAASE